MKNLRVTKIEDEQIEFQGGIKLYSHHDRDCCEHHWLSFKDLTIEDFEDLEFDLSNDEFFKRIDGYGIELIPVNGHSVKVPGYGANNGYYSSRLDLCLSGAGFEKTFDITECQVIEG